MVSNEIVGYGLYFLLTDVYFSVKIDICLHLIQAESKNMLR